MDVIRSPICTVMGHVDHGKSSVLDYIRKTNIVAKEAGAITQAIGASIVPIDTLRDICGKCLKDLKKEFFSIPGLLFIDTPGHAAFTNLRKRGGNLADIAILVVDLNEGIKPQTIEAMQILRQYKTPFVVAANKLDLVRGYRSKPNDPVIKNIETHEQELITTIETKVYELVGALSEQGFNADRFDRVNDYTQQIAIVPISALKGDGVPELLMIVVGLAQKFLEKKLHFDLSAPAKGTILEVKEEQGIGTSLDVIIYDGTLKTGDTIVIGSSNEPIVSKIRCLFQPAIHAEMRDKKSKYTAVKEVFAATGVKISGPGLEGVQSGMPILAATPETLEEAKKNISAEIDEVVFDGDEEGLVVKADSLGSLEALVRLLKEEGFPVRAAHVGPISKKDVAEAEANKNKLHKILLGFNIPSVEDDIPIITSPVIYTLIEEYKKWVTEQEIAILREKLEDVTKPVKLEYLQNHTFRQSNPAIVGIGVVSGTLKSGIQLMNADGVEIAMLRKMQKENKSVSEAQRGDQVAVALEGCTCGRQIEEGDIFYSQLTEQEFLKLKKVKEALTGEEKALLKEIAEIMRKKDPVWGV